MDKNKKSILENPKIAVSGYSIERGNTTYKNTLEERIQAAREASLAAKQAQKQNNKEKHSWKNSLNTVLKNDRYFQNMTIKKNTSDNQELKKKNIQCLSSSFKNDFKPTINVLSSNTTLPNTYLLTKHNTNSSLKSSVKTGGLMQRRLEAIKANNKKSNTISFEYNNILESNNSKNILLNNLICQSTRTQNKLSHQSNSNAYKIKSTVQNNPSSEIEHYDYTKNNNTSNNLVSSVQNRLIRAKEEMIANKLKYPNKNTFSKIETVENQPVHSMVNIHQNTLKIKKNRSCHLNQSIKKKTPYFTSNSKKIVSNNSDINNVDDTQLQVTVQTNLIAPKEMFNASETIESTKLKNQDLLKKSKQMELGSSSLIMPQSNSVQHRLKKFIRPRVINDDPMEWEDIIEDNIVEKVNDLRKNTHEYEPMEWIPDTIMHADEINHCLVIDTNILLSDLQSITAVINKFLPEYGYPTIVLPWQVLQELDHIKKGENALGYRAREAIRWLLEMLSNRHPRLKGQPMMQKTNITPDDSILKCAIIVKERVNFVTLVTNDKVLNIKSNVTGIPAKDSMWLRSLVSIKNTNESKVFQEAVKNYPIIENKSIMELESRLEHIIARVLKFAVGHNMNIATYNKNYWWKVYSLTPPFNLTKCLLSLKEHWNIIAPEQLLFKTPKKQLDWLIIFFDDFHKSSPEINLDWNDMYSFLKYCTEVINFLPYEYYNITDMILNDLMKARTFLYQKRKLECINNNHNDESSILLSNLNISNDNIFNIGDVLQNISNKVDTFCSYVYKANGFIRNTSENENIMFTKSIYSNELIEDYCHKLSNIIKVMLKINKWKVEEILESNIMINEFSRVIVDLDNDLVKLNKESLIEYCLMKNKNSFLKILISFQNNLAAMKNLLITIKS